MNRRNQIQLTPEEQAVFLREPNKAALATIERMAEIDLTAHVDKVGRLVQAGWKAAAASRKIAVKVGGLPALCSLSFDLGDQSRLAMTLFTQEMLLRGYLASGGFYPTYGHDENAVGAYLNAVEEVFGYIKSCLDRGELASALAGPIAQSGFARLT